MDTRLQRIVLLSWQAADVWQNATLIRSTSPAQYSSNPMKIHGEQDVAGAENSKKWDSWGK
jgi:hypothetical protein